MQHITVYKDPEAYIAFPSLVRLENGDLLATFREGSQFSVEKARTGQHTHLDAHSRICLVRSTDGGQSWDPATKSVIYDEGLDGGVALTVLSDGVIIAGLYQMWQLVPRERRSEIEGPIVRHDPLLGLVGATMGSAVRRSYDGGRTWSKELRWVRLEHPVGRNASESRAGVVELPDGTLIWWIADGEPVRGGRVWLMHSWDRGDTWGDPVLVAADPAAEKPYSAGISFGESHFLPLGDGRIIALLRTEPRDGPGEGYLYQTTSHDWGMSWKQYHRTPIWGHPPHLLKLQSGAILCTYGYRRPPYGVRACFSYDGGQTWDIEHEVILRQDGLGRDLGYPSSVQFPDGRLLTVYYIYGADQVRHIEGTFWREGEAQKPA